MRQFWIALVCLSALTLALKVERAEPLSAGPENGICPPSVVASNEFALAVVVPGNAEPTPSMLLLLVVGLSGLTAVGGRSRDREKPPTSG